MGNVPERSPIRVKCSTIHVSWAYPVLEYHFIRHCRMVSLFSVTAQGLSPRVLSCFALLIGDHLLSVGLHRERQYNIVINLPGLRSLITELELDPPYGFLGTP